MSLSGRYICCRGAVRLREIQFLTGDGHQSVAG